MANSKHSISSSKSLIEFQESYLSAVSKEDKDKIWDRVNTPLVEEISGDPSHNLVTFLYRYNESAIKEQPSIYLHCDVVGLPLFENNRLKPIPGTDICYLTLALPSTLRTAYTFLNVGGFFSNRRNRKFNTSAFPLSKIYWEN